MSTVCVFGPIHMFGTEYLPIYKKMNKICENYFDKVIGTWPEFWNWRGTPKNFYKISVKVTTSCNLFIAEVSMPSHGLGMEMQMASEHNIPIIAFAKKGFKPSKMVLGLPSLKRMIYYKDTEELLKKLEFEIKKFKN
jgi:hypothetical protein